MAEGDGAIYNNFKEQVLLGAFNLGNGADAIKMILVNDYTPDIDGHATYADVSAKEYGTGSGYTAGGQTLTGQAVSQDNANDRAKWDATDVTFTALGPLSPVTPSHCILYDDTHASDLLICYWALGTTPTNGGNYTLQFGADGIMTLT